MLTILALSLIGLTAALLLQSLYPGGVCWRHGDAGVRVIGRDGALWIDRLSDANAFWQHEREGWSYHFDAFYGDPVIVAPSTLGFQVTHGRSGTRYVLPYWPLLLCAVSGAWYVGRPVWLRIRGHRRLLRGQCPACGYDLRASKDRCPECGALISQPCDSRI